MRQHSAITSDPGPVVPGTTAGVRPGGERLAGLALFRFLAAAAVIWTHAASHYPTGDHFNAASMFRFGSAFFVQCSVFLVLLKAFRRPDLTLPTYVRSRFVRVYLPFLAWTVIYVVLREVKVRLFTHDATDSMAITWSLLWNGGDYHLWFLPFILVVSVVLFPVGQWMAAGGGRRMVGVSVAFAVAGVVVALMPSKTAYGHFDEQYLLHEGWDRVPSVLWGAALAGLFASGAIARVPRRVVTGLGAVVMIGSLATMAMNGHYRESDAPFANAAGLGAMLLAVTVLAGREMPGLMKLAALTYGIYLSHLLFVGAIRVVALRLGGDDNIAFAVVTTALALALSTLTAWVLSRVPGLGWLIANDASAAKRKTRPAMAPEVQAGSTTVVV